MSVIHGEVDFYGAVDGLLPHQRQFIGSAQRNVAYVGGMGSGKTVALCLAALLNAVNDPSGFSLIGRRNIPALQNSTMRIFLELVPETWGEWKSSEHRWIASNGHEIVFLHLDTSDPKVAGHIKSMNLSAAYIDEATEISEDIYLLVDSRVRRRSAPRHLVRLASNPAGHDWVWRRFFDPDRPDKLRANLGITASMLDNTHLSPAYIENALSMWPRDWQDRYVHGHFADFSDLIYKAFSERTHVWRAGRSYDIFGGESPPVQWPTVVGVDIGSDIDPWAIALIAVAPDGRLFQFDEVYGSSMLIENIAASLHAKLSGRPTPDIAYDYAQRQCALELAECGIHGQPALKEVEPGLFKTTQYMNLDKRLAHPFDPTLEGSPRYLVSSNCYNTIRELSAYKWEKDRKGEATGRPSHEHSHSPDAIRYAIHTFRPLPEKPTELKAWQNPGLDALSREYWRDVERHKRPGDDAPNVLRFGKPKTMREWDALEAKRRAQSVRFRRPAMLKSKRPIL